MSSQLGQQSGFDPGGPSQGASQDLPKAPSPKTAPARPSPPKDETGTGLSADAIEAGDAAPEEDEFLAQGWDATSSNASTSVTPSIYQHTFENGRRYHAYKYGRYPIPNDDLEQNREDMKHAMMMEITDGKLFFAPIGDNPKKIIDIGTGTGVWAVEVGDQFPGAEILGLDLSPIQPQWIPPNVRFIIDDAEDEWASGSGWDFAHFRTMAPVLRDVQKAIDQTFRHLKPGGWIEFQESNGRPFCDDGTMGDDDVLASFYSLCTEALGRFGMDIDIGTRVGGLLERAGFALSLGGEPVQVAKRHVRRRGTAGQQGNIYKTFAPWHLLHLQSFPDDEHSMRSEDLKKTFYNGPYAFLDSLSAEYRDAVKRYTILNQMITKLITPPNQFMFDSKLRDKLLFEDKDFTYSRRYFWAYNTLGVINDGIKSMRAAYLDTFTKEFWAGCHATLWPHPNPNSAEGREYLARMEGPRQELDAAVRDLQEMYDKNSRTRDEVRSLREQLFSGSSVKESRRAIEQGDNIKILTSVSMIFLPLTFVTSIFGITTLTLTVDDWQFPVIMVSVCIPFFLLILILAVRKSTIAIDKYKDLFWRLLYYLHISSAATSTGAEQADRRRLRRFRRIQKETRQEGGPRPGILKRAQSGLHHHHHHNHHRDHHGAGRPSGLRRSQSGLQQQPQQQLHGGGGSDAEGAAGRWTIWSKIGVVSRLWSSGPGGKQNGVTGDTKEDRNHDGIV